MSLFRGENQTSSDQRITYFAETDARGQRTKFGIRDIDRTKHIYVIGKSGMGKSTLLENLAAQDIQNGNGMCFIDPHGSAIETLLDYIPKERVDDVVYFAPFDVEYPIAFNPLEDIGPEKRHLVAQGMSSAFKKIWGEETFSDRMEHIINNTLLALLEYPGATLLSIPRMYTDDDYRKKVVDNITDPSVGAFWRKEFAGWTDRYRQEALPSILNKVGQFTSNPLVRNIIGQPKSSFDFRRVMDEKKILLVNLSIGQVGEGNANLLGAMITTKIFLAGLSRADMEKSDLKASPNFYLYIDEFQNLANDSFEGILSQARKYKLNLTLAHQYVEQMPETVRAAVFGNVGTMISFRIGPDDAEIFEKQFAQKFTADDLVNMGFTQIYLSLMIDGVGSQPFSARTLPPLETPAINFRQEAIEASRRQFGNKRSEVEAEVLKWIDTTPDVKPKGKNNYQGNKPPFNKNAPGGAKPAFNKEHVAQKKKFVRPEAAPTDDMLSDLPGTNSLADALKELKQDTSDNKNHKEIQDKSKPKKDLHHKKPNQSKPKQHDKKPDGGLGDFIKQARSE